jgi:hypothetical protein
MITTIFSPLSFLLLLFLDPGSGMGKIQDSGIRGKHPGSAILCTVPVVVTTFKGESNVKQKDS